MEWDFIRPARQQLSLDNNLDEVSSVESSQTQPFFLHPKLTWDALAFLEEVLGPSTISVSSEVVVGVLFTAFPVPELLCHFIRVLYTMMHRPRVRMQCGLMWDWPQAKRTLTSKSQSHECLCAPLISFISLITPFKSVKWKYNITRHANFSGGSNTNAFVVGPERVEKFKFEWNSSV